MKLEPGAEGRLHLVTDVLRSFADATTDETRLLQTIVERVAELVEHPCTVRLLSADEQTLETAAMFDPLDDPVFRALASHTIPVSAPLQIALEARRAFLQPISNATVKEVHPEAEATALTPKSVVVAPLIARGKALGLLFIVVRGAGHVELEPEAVALVEALASHAALALANARLIRSLAQNERARQHKRSILDTVTTPLLLLNRARVIIGANRAFLGMFGVEERDTLGRDVLEVADGVLGLPAMCALFEDLPPRGTDADGLELDVTTAIGLRPLLIRTTQTFRPDNASETTLVTFVDLTERIVAQKTARRQRLMLDSMREVVVGLDADFRVEDWNPAAEVLFGFSAEEARGLPIREVFAISELDEAAHSDRIAALRMGTTLHAQTRIRARDGRWLDVEHSTSPLMEKGIATGFVCVMLDVSERVRLERALRDRFDEVTVANEDLESFSYSVSHDLRAPVRAIDGFSEILEQDHAELLDDEGRRVLGLVRKNAKRMGLLIDDLLALARYGRKTIVATTVDMNALAKTTLEEALRVEQRDYEVKLASLPEAVGDEGLLRQVFLNLYANAVKYARKKASPRIETTADETADEVIYTIKDNGAGFDMRYVDKLFGTFERLHTTKEFEGTGIGLALVARIVKRHGGRVWGEGAVDHGATFHVALPKPNRPNGPNGPNEPNGPNGKEVE